MNCLKMRAACRTLFHLTSFSKLHVEHVSFKFVEKNFLGFVAIGILSVKFPSQVAKHCLSQDYVYSDDRSSSYLLKLTFLT